MSRTPDSILLLGESGVGKTHFGAQLLSRLMKGDGHLRMSGQATNLEPFEAALDSLNQGKAAGHTATSTYTESIWPLAEDTGRLAELIWPDYGGEQIKTMINSRRVPTVWQTRVHETRIWLLLVRLQHTRAENDMFSRPLMSLRSTSSANHAVQLSDQARLIEFLQMLVFAGCSHAERPLDSPRLGILLTCWDETGFNGTPEAAIEDRLPMFWDFVRSNWRTPLIMGLSALGRPLSPSERDLDYASFGPENFGYCVQPDGSQSSDLTLPIYLLLDGLR